MWTTKGRIFGGMVVFFMLMIAAAGNDDDSSEEGDEHPGKIRHGRKLGKYKYKEEVIKRVEFNHPCRLAQTAVKVTFPGMKSEVLVSFLGYKEPNLMHVMRCKGHCSNKALSKVACVPTKRKLKRVKMKLKTQVLGSEAKEKFQELVLEEHEECGCQCLSVTPGHCLDPDAFNNETCSCACDNSPFSRDQLQCEAYAERRWDPVTCTCRHKDEVIMHQTTLLDGAHKVLGGNSGGEHHSGGSSGTTVDTSRRGHDTVPAIPGCTSDDCTLTGCLGHDHSATGIAAMPNATTDASSSVRTWTAVGICSFLICLLAFTTCYYRRKSRQLQLIKSVADEGDALLVPSSTFLDDKFTMKSMEAVGSQVTLHEGGDILAPSVEVVANICDNQKSEHSRGHQIGNHRQQVTNSQSHQSLGMIPLRLLGDDSTSGLGGIVSALLNGRSGPRTHEVVVHSPAAVLNGGKNLAKAASMSELDQSIVAENPLCLHSESVTDNVAKSHVDLYDVSTTFCHNCLHASLSRHGRHRHHHNHPQHSRTYQPHQQRPRQQQLQQHSHHQQQQQQQQKVHHLHHHFQDEDELMHAQAHRQKFRHRPKSQEHLIEPERAVELLQKCLLTLGDSSGLVLQQLTQQQFQVQHHPDQKHYHQEHGHAQDLPRHRHKRNKVSSSTATSPC